MQKELSYLLDKDFKVYVGGEYERRTNFLGMMNLLAHRSDFFRFHSSQQQSFIKKCIKEKSIYVDADILLTFKR